MTCPKCNEPCDMLKFTSSGVMCRKCHAIITKLKANKPVTIELLAYCNGCGMLRSQCDCWDPVNQP